MPALPAAGDVLRCTMRWTDTVVTFGSRFYIGYTGTTPTATDCANLATSIAANWNSHLSSITENAYALVFVEVQDLSSDTGAFGTWEGSHAGTGGSGAVPVATAAVIDFTIARKYRGGKPKLFHAPGPSTDLQTRERWTTTYAANLTSGWSGFMTNVLLTTGLGPSLTNQVNVSYYQGFTVVTSPTTGRSRNVPKVRTTPRVDAVTSATGNVILGSQRRRRSSTT